MADEAAHIVSQTGVKDLNLAASDVSNLADALIEFYAVGSPHGAENYFSRALARICKAKRFSSSMTSPLHVFEGAGAFKRKIHLAEFEHLAGSRVGLTLVAKIAPNFLIKDTATANFCLPTKTKVSTYSYRKAGDEPVRIVKPVPQSASPAFQNSIPLGRRRFAFHLPPRA